MDFKNSNLILRGLYEFLRKEFFKNSNFILACNVREENYYNAHTDPKQDFSCNVSKCLFIRKTHLMVGLRVGGIGFVGVESI